MVRKHVLKKCLYSADNLCRIMKKAWLLNKMLNINDGFDPTKSHWDKLTI